MQGGKEVSAGPSVVIFPCQTSKSSLHLNAETSPDWSIPMVLEDGKQANVGAMRFS